MPRRVMSTDVEPPERTSSSGRSSATASRSAVFFAPSGSHAALAGTGADCPRPEKVTCEPRSSMIGPHVLDSQ